MKNTTPLSFGEKIKQIRIAKGLKQEDLAKVINTAQNFVSRLESGEAKYDDRMLEIIREFYNIKNAPIFDHELDDYKNRVWVCNDLITANNMHEARVIQDTLSPILELPFEHDLTLLYLMIEARILFKENNLAAGEERLKTAEALLDGASMEALHLYHRNKGFLLMRKGEFKTSLKHYLQSLDNETSIVNSDMSILLSIGIVCLSLSKPWNAVLYLEKAKMKYNLGRTNVLGAILNSRLASCYMLVGEYDKAESIYNDALAQAKSINASDSIGIALTWLATLYKQTDNIAKSLEASNQALTFLKDDSHCADVLMNKALCLIEMKDFAQCREVIMQGKELAKNNQRQATLFEVISHLLTLDNSESTDYLENYAIPYYRTDDSVEAGKLQALEFCNMLEAHYRKKRNKKKANDIAIVGRDIYKEIYFGALEL